MGKNNQEKEVKAITAEELDEKFEKGEDVSEYFDWDSAVKRFPASAPSWAVNEIDLECKRRGNNRENYVRELVVDQAELLRVAREAREEASRRRLEIRKEPGVIAARTPADDVADEAEAAARLSRNRAELAKGFRKAHRK